MDVDKGKSIVVSSDSGTAQSDLGTSQSRGKDVSVEPEEIGRAHV